MSTTVATVSGTGVAGVASAAVIGRDTARQELTIVNDHATQLIYLQLATTTPAAPTAVVGQGIRLNAAGGSWTTTKYDGAVACIATGASTNYTIVAF